MILELKSSEFRDPVHGFIDVYEHERAIIATPEFQRLRWIHQLGLTSYVYHGAEHSRFGHSLGVMHLAGEATRLIFDKKHEVLTSTLSNEDGGSSLPRRLYAAARLAGLLHDIGHAPFSHSGESRLFPERLGHEDYTLPIIENSCIGCIIDKYSSSTGVSCEDIENILSEERIFEASFVKELISSPWDVDKMDYLLRDSLYCGVEYGRFDLRRLLRTLTLDNGLQDGSLRLAIDVDGMHTVEALVLARYFMFTQVYFHDVRRAFDMVLGDFIGSCLNDKYGKDEYPPPDNAQEYLTWDDCLLLAKARSLASAEEKNPAWRIVLRKHPKAVYSTLPHPSPIQIRRAASMAEECRSRFPGHRFWLDRALDHPEKFKKVDMPIMEGQEMRGSLAKESSALAGLQEIGQFRLYADVVDERRQQEITDHCSDYMAAV